MTARAAAVGKRRGAASTNALTGSAMARRRAGDVALSQTTALAASAAPQTAKHSSGASTGAGAAATTSAMSFCFSRKLLASRALVKLRAKMLSVFERICVLRCGQIARSRWRCFGAPKRAARACENRFMQIAVPLFCQWLCASCGTPQTAKSPLRDLVNMMVLVLGLQVE